MSSLPVISHRLFVAAAGQSDSPERELCPPERPWSSGESPREIPFELRVQSLPDDRERALAAELASSDY